MEYLIDEDEANIINKESEQEEFEGDSLVDQLKEAVADFSRPWQEMLGTDTVY